MKILCTPDCPLSPVAVAVVPGFCDVEPHVDAVSNWDAVPHSDVGPHVDAVPSWDAVPHSAVASHDDVAQENLSGLSFMIPCSFTLNSANATSITVPQHQIR